MSSFSIVGTVSKSATLEELLKHPSELRNCDIVELRFDEFMHLEQCLDLCKKLRQYSKVLLTIRTNREGGTWQIDDEKRFELFSAFFTVVDMIDIEIQSDIFKNHCRQEFPANIRLIASYHDYEKTPNVATLQKLIDRGKAWNADIVKLAVMPTAKEDIITLGSLLPQGKLCLIAMGEMGQETRITFPRQGSVLTYGYLDQIAAPGQLSAKQLKLALHST